MAHLETHNHQYRTIAPFLTSWEMTKLMTKIKESDRFRLGDFSHIYLNGTDICVGYLGDETAEEVDPQRKETASQRRILRKYFHSV